jgi:isoquinoline 1-oxidoreductase alpha subunit
MDGQAIRSCSLPIKLAIDKKITTIEGLSENGDHPMQQAWVDKNVPQCGYCQSGQIMNAAALLKAIPNPSEQEIIDGMSGNICRCGTYNRIKEAIQLAAKK